MKSLRSSDLIGWVLLVAVVTFGVGLIVTPSTAAPVATGTFVAKVDKHDKPKPDPYAEYVALGDSWTADVVILNGDGVPATEHAPIDCAQSHRNYPKLVAKALGVPTFRDASCGSATTDDFRNPQEDLPVGGTNPPQFDRLTKDTTLVTVGIGGNDAGIASAALDCLNVLPVDNPLANNPAGVPAGGCKAKYTAGGVDQLSASIKASLPKLVRAYKRIHRISPKARILAIDYLSAVPEHACYPTLPATETDVQYLHAKFLELHKMVRRAAAKGGVEYVDTYTPSLGHDVCQGPTVRYAEVVGVSVNDVAVGVPAHPNAAGARAQARIVLDYLSKNPRRIE
jgi:lysophospholipase L1-like esterase